MPEGFDSSAMLDKIRKMLDRAEDSRLTPGERENANNLAMQFADRYNVDLAVARSRQKVIPSTSIVDRRFDVNRPFLQQKRLANSVYTNYGCQLLSVGRGREGRGSLHGFGFEADMELADLLFTSIVLQASGGAARAYREYVKNFRPWSCGECGSDEWKEVPRDENCYYCTECNQEFYSSHAPPAIPERRSTWYRSYWDEYVGIVAQRLAQQKRAVRKEMDMESDDSGQSTTVALRDRDKLVGERMHQRYSKIGKGRQTRRPSGGGGSAGRADGMRADLGTGQLAGRKRIAK